MTARTATLILIFTLLPNLAVAAEDRLRDPTQPQLYKDIATVPINSEIKVDAIFTNKDHKTALIEGNIFTIGDTILDSTIIAIDSHSIRLKNEQGEFEVTMPYSNVKSSIIKNRKNASEKIE